MELSAPIRIRPERFSRIVQRLYFRRKFFDGLIPGRRFGFSETTPLVVLFSTPGARREKSIGSGILFRHCPLFLLRSLHEGRHSANIKYLTLLFPLIARQGAAPVAAREKTPVALEVRAALVGQEAAARPGLAAALRAFS